MIKNVILSTLAIAVLAGCSGKKDSDKDTSVVEAIPVKIQKLEKELGFPLFTHEKIRLPLMKRAR